LNKHIATIKNSEQHLHAKYNLDLGINIFNHSYFAEQFTTLLRVPYPKLLSKARWDNWRGFSSFREKVR